MITQVALALALALPPFAPGPAPGGVELSPCPVAVPDHTVCGFLLVPERRDAPGRTIRVGYAVHTSTASGRAADPVVFMNGGPGTSSIPLIGLVSRMFPDRDVVAVEQRGGRHSRPALGCPETAEAMLGLLRDPATGGATDTGVVAEAGSGGPEARSGRPVAESGGPETESGEPAAESDGSETESGAAESGGPEAGQAGGQGAGQAGGQGAGQVGGRDGRTGVGAAAGACRERLREQGVDLRGYTTKEIAADVVRLREVLGHASWNLFGVGYSTRVMLDVAAADPDGVRSVVLDSFLPESAAWYDEADRGLADAMARLGLRDRFEAMVRRLNARPARVPVTDPLLGTEFTARLTGDDTATLLAETLREPGGTPGAADAADKPDETPGEADAAGEPGEPGGAGAVGEPGGAGGAGAVGAAGGAGTVGGAAVVDVLVGALASGHDELLSPPADALAEGLMARELGLYHAVQCQDEVPFNTFTTSSRLFTVNADIAVCDAWKLPASEPANSSTDAPVLAVGGRADPTTPSGTGRAAAERLPDGRFVEFAGLGHAVSLAGSPAGACAREHIRAFVADPARPASLQPASQPSSLQPSSQPSSLCSPEQAPPRPADVRVSAAPYRMAAAPWLAAPFALFALASVAQLLAGAARGRALTAYAGLTGVAFSWLVAKEVYGRANETVLTVGVPAMTGPYSWVAVGSAVLALAAFARRRGWGQAVAALIGAGFLVWWFAWFL